MATGNFREFAPDYEIWNKDTNNFAPRLGFALDVLGNRKLVLRAGAGIMYDRIYNNVFENIRFNPPYFSDNQIGLFRNVSGGGPIRAWTGDLSVRIGRTVASPSVTHAVPNPRHMDQNMVTPYYEQMHLGVQWEFAKGCVFEPEYVGTFGHKLTRIIDINTFDGRIACPPPADPTKPYTSGPCFDNNFLQGFSTHRPNPNIGADNFRTNAFSLQLPFSPV